MLEIRRLVIRFATESSTRGYTRIQDVLADLGHRVGRTTVARILKDEGIKPAPERPSSWSDFLKAHWGQVAAADFFTTEVWTPKGLVTYYTLFVIDLESRRATVLTPPRAPNCNAYAERFVRSIKEECLGRMIMFGESSLRRAISQYAEHDHRERPHQGLGNKVLQGAFRPRCRPTAVEALERLGGLLRSYGPAA